jgi:hypothetical protein
LSAAIIISGLPRLRTRVLPIFWTTGDFPEQRSSGNDAVGGKIVRRDGFSCSGAGRIV